MTDLRDSDAALLAKSGRMAEAAALARPVRRELDPLQKMMGLPSPVWENAATSKLTDDHCVIFNGDRRCPGLATHLAWIGCTVGEHLDKSSVCAAHAGMLGRNQTVYRCRRCWDAVRAVSDARIIKIEAIDDGDTEPSSGQVPGLLP
jgi:hypothetical protein